MPTPFPPQPISLTGHVVPEERLELIRAHVTLLAETARQISDTLGLGDDSTDMIRVLEAEEDR